MVPRALEVKLIDDWILYLASAVLHDHQTDPLEASEFDLIQAYYQRQEAPLLVLTLLLKVFNHCVQHFKKHCPFLGADCLNNILLVLAEEEKASRLASLVGRHGTAGLLV